MILPGPLTGELFVSKRYKGWYAQNGLVPPQHRDSELNFGEPSTIHTPLEIIISRNGCDFVGIAKVNNEEQAVRGDFTKDGMRLEIGYAYLNLKRHSKNPNMFLGPADFGVSGYCRIELCDTNREIAFGK